MKNKLEPWTRVYFLFKYWKYSNLFLVDRFKNKMAGWGNFIFISSKSAQIFKKIATFSKDGLFSSRNLHNEDFSSGKQRM